MGMTHAVFCGSLSQNLQEYRYQSTYTLTGIHLFWRGVSNNLWIPFIFNLWILTIFRMHLVDAVHWLLNASREIYFLYKRLENDYTLFIIFWPRLCMLILSNLIILNIPVGQRLLLLREGRCIWFKWQFTPFW